jgi:hypothetical protein
MSPREIDRLEILGGVAERRLTSGGTPLRPDIHKLV